MKFRKKPVVIEAWQWDGTYNDMIRLQKQLPNMVTLKTSLNPKNNTVSKWRIGTPEGGREVSSGDWIIQGAKGEFYPCKPYIFETTYESVG